jgi:hypothetical protein
MTAIFGTLCNDNGGWNGGDPWRELRGTDASG